MADQKNNESGKLTTIIGADVQIKGDMLFSNPACILGEVEGTIIGKSEISVGEGAVCKASIEAQVITVDGTVEGDINATERLQLNASARVTGDLVAQTMSIAEGASFVGHCRVGANAIKSHGSGGLASGLEVKTKGGHPQLANANIADLRAKIAGLAQTKVG
jgi:cytoskeletal protein CcmA (bactofilin family)